MKELKDMSKKDIKEANKLIKRLCHKNKEEKFNNKAILFSKLLLAISVVCSLIVISYEGFSLFNVLTLILSVILPYLMLMYFRMKLWQNRESLISDYIKNKKNDI